MMLDSAISMTKTLVGFDTSTGQSNLNLLDYVVEYLKSLGYRFRFTHSDDGTKANLLASIGPANQAGIILSGHSDVVPANAADWSLNPFKAEVREDRLYGRGACDMKSFLGLCLSMAPEFAEADLPLHIALSYDEEIGCIGAPRMVDDLNNLPTPPRLCLIGEPTLMRTIVGHKGKTNILCRIVGRECHSSTHHLGVNAVEIAAALIHFLSEKQRSLRQDGLLDSGYDPPYTTLHTGWIHGGKAVNIVAQDCRFEFEIRDLPGFDTPALRADIDHYVAERTADMRRIAPESGISLEILSTTPPLTGPEDSEAVRLTHHCAGHDAGYERCEKVCFGTEAGLFHQAGIPAVVCGPGDIAQAHRADEFISLDQLRQGRDFLVRLGQWLQDQGRTST